MVDPMWSPLFLRHFLSVRHLCPDAAGFRTINRSSYKRHPFDTVIDYDPKELEGLNARLLHAMPYAEAAPRLDGGRAHFAPQTHDELLDGIGVARLVCAIKMLRQFVGRHRAILRTADAAG